MAPQRPFRFDLRNLFGVVTALAALMGLVRFLIVSDLANMVLGACLMAYPGFALATALTVLGSGVGQRAGATVAAISGALVGHAMLWLMMPLAPQVDSTQPEFLARACLSAIFLLLGTAAILWVIWRDDGVAAVPDLGRLLQVKRDLWRNRRGTDPSG